MREVTRPVAFGKPATKICEELKKKDMQICELRYGMLLIIVSNHFASLFIGCSCIELGHSPQQIV